MVDVHTLCLNMIGNPQRAVLRFPGKKFRLEQASEALQESVREARGAKIFLEG